MKRYALLCLLVLLGACSKLNADNYARIQLGMSYDEVSAILGKADRCDDTAGFKSCQWANEETKISLQFVGDSLVMRSATNLR